MLGFQDAGFVTEGFCYLAHSLHNVQLTDYRGNTFREAGLEEDAKNSLVEVGDLGQLEQEPEKERDRRAASNPANMLQLVV